MCNAEVKASVEVAGNEVGCEAEEEDDDDDDEEEADDDEDGRVIASLSPVWQPDIACWANGCSRVVLPHYSQEAKTER